MDYPHSYDEIKTGRSSFENYIKNNYPAFFEYLSKNYPVECSYQEKVYMFLNNIKTRPVCKVCGNPVKFFSNSKGFGTYCSSKCAMSDKEHVEKQKQTCLERYGSKNNINKGRETKKKKYGNENYNNAKKQKQTCLERYGVENPMQSEEIKKKSRKTCLEKYGSEYVLNSDFFLRNKEMHQKKTKKTCLERYGSESPMQSDEIKLKTRNTCLEKYGTEWNCMRKEAHNSRNFKSLPNQRFSGLLDENQIPYEREYVIENRVYDFKVGNVLIEINPTATHNINWNPFSNKKCIDKNYHFDKTVLALKNNFRVIHVWDWDDTNTIIGMLKRKTVLYARKCEIKEVSKKETREFLNIYHLQGNCNNQNIRIGLYYNDELVEIMTFGKPRYNKNYEYELLRLCTHGEYMVVGGSEKLFKYFVVNYNPGSIISYCDSSKFTGEVYEHLGFKLFAYNSPSCHWYNMKTGKHITNNLLIQKGYDKLFGTNYGKGTSNEKIMLENGFLQVYDAGQKTYVYERMDS